MITRLAKSSLAQDLPRYRSMLAGNDAYIPTNFESIASATGTGSSGTITFSNIPNTYQHLQIRYTARTTAAQTITDCQIKFNSATTDYANHSFQGNGSIVETKNDTGNTYMILYQSITGASASSNIMGVGVIDIHDYVSTSKNKVFRAFSGQDRNGAGAVWLSSGLWVSTAALSSISFTLSSGSFTTSSTFALYGIKS